MCRCGKFRTFLSKQFCVRKYHFNDSNVFCKIIDFVESSFEMEISNVDNYNITSILPPGLVIVWGQKSLS